MKTAHVLILTALAAAIAAAVPTGAQDGRPLRTLPYGDYQCALPGDAAGDAFRIVESEGFSIVQGSGYRDANGARGLNLLRGDEVVFTSGARKGERYRREGNSTLKRMTPEGGIGRLTCTRLGGTG